MDSETLWESVPENFGLEQARQIMEAVAFHSPLGVFLGTQNAGCFYVNQVCADIFGMPPKECIGFGWTRVLHPDDLRATQAVIEKFELTGEPVTVQYRVCRDDGSEKTVVARACKVMYGSVQGSIVTLEDVSERVALREAIREPQRLNAIGRLASGVAHDINNILTAISASGDLIAFEQKRGTDSSESLQIIADAVERAQQVTSQLLTLSRHQVEAESIVKLDAEIQNIEPLLQRTLPETIRVRFETGCADIGVAIGPAALGQILINLVVNARDAMPTGGEIGVTTRIARGEVAPDNKRDWALIEVTDSGVGIPKEVLAQVTEPFFTTKAPGQGTGLGLSNVKDIVERSQGHLEIKSEEGAGTRVIICFPVNDAASEKTIDGESMDNLNGTERILLLEDDPAIRCIVAQALCAFEYRVDAAPTIAQAREMIAAREYDGFVSDVVLTDGHGPNLFNELGVDKPIVFTSGWVGDSEQSMHLDRPNRSFLTKPYRPGPLMAELRRLFDS